MLATIDAFCIKNGLDSMEVLTRWDFSRVLQLLHVEAARNRSDLEWTWYPEPDAELLAKIESTFARKPVEWADIEPDFS